MAKVNLDTLKAWFKMGAKPTQAKLWNVFERWYLCVFEYHSFGFVLAPKDRHKTNRIPQRIAGDFL